MKLQRWLSLAIALWVIGGCKDSGTLDSIAVTPEKLSVSLYDEPIQYTATGSYSNGDSKDLTEEVVWSVDSTSDNLFSTAVPGLLSPRTAGSFVLTATFAVTDTSSDIVGYTTLRVTP
ncbi:MAG: hypothetical protein RRB13_00755 [bacterium]|nr:hypothetical protein [bacterium]